MLLAAQSGSYSAIVKNTVEVKDSVNIKAIVVPPDHVSDEDIIKRIKSGDVDAYGSIMRRYNQRVFRIARSIVTDDAVAMDIVQEAHIKAYTKLNEFQGKSAFITWLARITRNEALMYLRKYKKEVTMSAGTIASIGMPEDDRQFDMSVDRVCDVDNQSRLPDNVLEDKELKQLINKHVDKLPEDFRTVFILRAIEQFSGKETAEILSIKEETVKTRYFRAKRLLRGQIQMYLDSVSMKVYEFGGFHCDIIVGNVLGHLHSLHK